MPDLRKGEDELGLKLSAPKLASVIGAFASIFLPIAVQNQVAYVTLFYGAALSHAYFNLLF